MSPPKNGAKKFPITDGFTLAIAELVNRKVDILGLCEIGREDAVFLQALFQKEELAKYKVIDLYSPGKSIDDFCLIYNSEKFSLASVFESANIRDPLTEKWLKAGVFAQFKLQDDSTLYVGLSHWQSRQTYADGSENRLKLGQALRKKITELSDADPNALFILCGDYNDEPYHPSIVTGLGASRDAEFVRRRPNYFFNPFWGCLRSPCSSFPAGTYVHPTVIEASGGAVYDQIMFSSKFLESWKFEEACMVIDDIPVSSFGINWSEVSDHYPILSHLVRIDT